MEQQVLQIREWKEGESLDSLFTGDRVRMFDGINPVDGRFIGFYEEQGNGEYRFLSRQLELSPENTDIYRWRLSGIGEVVDFGRDYGLYFWFDGSFERKDYFEIVNRNEYDKLNREMELIGL
jgi:hypothetical protein